MGDKVFIMNFKNEKIGHVERKADVFEQELEGKITFHKTLPRIMQYIAPEPTQFPAAKEVLDYYKMERLDAWEYLQKSNGIKNSRDVWFMSEPVGEVWLPLVVGMQRYPRYESWFRTGDKVRVQMNGFANINRHSMEIFPECIVPYLKKDEASRFGTATGVVYDVRSWPSTRGLIGRIVINF
jgi:hypothetical protein